MPQVNSPLSTTTCNAGQSCLVQWLDNGETPLLADIGACYVGLYNGNGVSPAPAVGAQECHLTEYHRFLFSRLSQ